MTKETENNKSQNIKKIATLSKIYIAPEEEKSFEKSFKDILNLFEQLQSCNVNDITVNYTSSEDDREPRKDIEQTSNNNRYQVIKKSSPFFNDKTGYFEVPPVIE